MPFHPDADQRALISDAFSRPLDALLPLARLHGGAAEPWEALAELGVFGVAADPEIGGVGLSAAEESLLAAELGRRLASPKILATLMAYHVAEPEVAARIVAGACRVAPAILTGSRACIVDGEGAEYLLLRNAGEAALVRANALDRRAALEDDHWSTTLETAALDPAGIAWADDASALRRVRLIEASALCGFAECARDMAVAYAAFREQFGRPIGAFQAVKHHTANMAMAARAAGDLATFAATALDQARGDAPAQIEAALLVAIDAALANARLNIQVHGGIGFSDEADPHLVLKRAHLLIEAAGGADAAAERVAIAGPTMTAPTMTAT